MQVTNDLAVLMVDDFEAAAQLPFTEETRKRAYGKRCANSLPRREVS